MKTNMFADDSDFWSLKCTNVAGIWVKFFFLLLIINGKVLQRVSMN